MKEFAGLVNKTLRRCQAYLMRSVRVVFQRGLGHVLKNFWALHAKAN